MSIAISTPMGIPAPVAPQLPRKTLAELLHELGDIPAHRVRLPGFALALAELFTAFDEGLRPTP